MIKYESFTSRFYPKIPVKESFTSGFYPKFPVKESYTSGFYPKIPVNEYQSKKSYRSNDNFFDSTVYLYMCFSKAI
jgi:hypothetical protein